MSRKVRHNMPKQNQLEEGQASATDGSPAQPKRSPRNEVRASNFFSVYTNDVEVQTTPWDVRMVLSEIYIPKEGPRVLNVTQLGEVRLSPQLAKQVVTILAQQLRQYEERFGEIPAPKD